MTIEKTDQSSEVADDELMTEAEQYAREQSAATRNGVVAPFGSPSDTDAQYASEAAPGLDYDADLRDGFALKYGDAL